MDKLGSGTGDITNHFEVWPMADINYKRQVKLFKALNSEVRLRLLRRATEEEAISAPDLAREEEFEITPESIVNNLNRLEEAGFLESSDVRGPGNRPRKEFSLKGNGRSLVFEVIKDDYLFTFEEPDVADY
jgi:predicted transcriptional regulator